MFIFSGTVSANVGDIITQGSNTGYIDKIVKETIDLYADIKKIDIQDPSESRRIIALDLIDYFSKAKLQKTQAKPLWLLS